MRLAGGAWLALLALAGCGPSEDERRLQRMLSDVSRDLADSPDLRDRRGLPAGGPMPYAVAGDELIRLDTGFVALDRCWTFDSLRDAGLEVRGMSLLRDAEIYERRLGEPLLRKDGERADTLAYWIIPVRNGGDDAADSAADSAEQQDAHTPGDAATPAEPDPALLDKGLLWARGPSGREAGAPAPSALPPALMYMHLRADIMELGVEPIPEEVEALYFPPHREERYARDPARLDVFITPMAGEGEGKLSPRGRMDKKQWRRVNSGLRVRPVDKAEVGVAADDPMEYHRTELGPIGEDGNGAAGFLLRTYDFANWRAIKFWGSDVYSDPNDPTKVVPPSIRNITFNPGIPLHSLLVTMWEQAHDGSHRKEFTIAADYVPQATAVMDAVSARLAEAKVECHASP